LFKALLSSIKTGFNWIAQKAQEHFGVNGTSLQSGVSSVVLHKFRALPDTVGEIRLEFNLVKLEIFSTVEITLESLML
jgi:hypothetical protein